LIDFREPDKKLNKKLNDDAVLAFKDILAFTRARFHTFGDAAAYQLIQKGILEVHIRDELYAQVIKQTTDCPTQ